VRDSEYTRNHGRRDGPRVMDGNSGKMTKERYVSKYIDRRELY